MANTNLNISAQSFITVPAFVDANVDPTANIGAAKIVHRIPFSFFQSGNVAASDQFINSIRGSAGSIRSVYAACTRAPASYTGGTVDVRLMRGGTATSILSGATAFALTAANFPTAGVYVNIPLNASPTSANTNDWIEIITVAGTGGTAMQGLSLVVETDITP